MAKLSIGAQEFYKPRLGNIQMVFLIIIYALVYALQFFSDLTVVLSLLAAFVGFIATTALTLYLYVKGVYKTKKNGALKMIVTMLTFLIEMIPEVDFIPADILDVIGMFILARMEDHEIAEGKAMDAAKAVQDQQQKAVQYADYINRRQQRQQEELQEAA